MSSAYTEFFESATGMARPFPYQIALAEETWPTLLDVPTGLGKTAAVILAWLHKRLHGDAATGRRLVYCLPMRALVEQTADAASRWCERAAPLFTARGLPAPTVHRLLGGDVDRSWAERPDESLILVGTQDLLLSRALNRGYAMSRYRWPMQFGLLNNDCLWVFDETQLVGVGIETSAQLQAFRRRLGAIEPVHTLWMSATLGERQLATVDHPRPAEGWPTSRLGDRDLEQETVRRRVEARKAVAQMEGPQIRKETGKHGSLGELAGRIADLHRERGGLTLVVVNRVSRAQALYAAVRSTVAAKTPAALLHSRFRSGDRSRQAMMLTGEGNRIVVATQAVEAGVDVSARTLVTELAPWPSLVQRFGRCNRYGEIPDAQIRWIDIDTADGRSGIELALPYAPEDLDGARELLGRLEEGGADAGPASLRRIEHDAPRLVRPVLRRPDLVDLFDTTPDICGDDIDVSRYVRDGDDTDLQLFWREIGGDAPPGDLAAPAREELCRVSIGAAKRFLVALAEKRKALSKKGERDRQRAAGLRAWVWDPIERRWRHLRPEGVHPGQIVLAHAAAGGYSAELGWTGEILPKEAVPLVAEGGGEETEMAADSLDGDPDTTLGKRRWVGLADHLARVRDEARALTERLGLAEPYGEPLATAGTWHDVGKAHEVFQHKLLDPVEDHPQLRPEGEGPWAKSCHRLSTKEKRRHFRHELASALAWLAAGGAEDPRFRDIVAYLVAAHHGKVRLSIRSVPGESPPDGDPERLFARGIWDGDLLPPVELPGGRRLREVRLDLGLMRLGEGSWLERMLALRDAEDLGPFRLAYLEALLTVADWRASRKEEGCDCA